MIPRIGSLWRIMGGSFFWPSKPFLQLSLFFAGKSYFHADHDGRLLWGFFFTLRYGIFNLHSWLLFLGRRGGGGFLLGRFRFEREICGWSVQKDMRLMIDDR